MDNDYSKTLNNLKLTFEGSETPEVISFLIRELNFNSTLKILDIGSGDLSGIISIAKQFDNYIQKIEIDAIDIYHPKSQIHIPANLFIKKIKGDFMSVAINKKYDIIFCRHTLYYLKNPKLAIERMLTYIKKTGLIVVIVWDKGCFLRKSCAHYQPSSFPSKLGKLMLESIGSSLKVHFKSFSFMGTINMDKYRSQNKDLEQLARLILRGPRTNKISIKKLADDLKKSKGVVKRVNAVIIYKL